MNHIALLDLFKGGI